jgi:hypothetical protein
MATAVNAGARLDRLPISSFHYRIFWLVGAGMFFDGYDLYVGTAVLPALLQSKFSTLAQNAQFVSFTFFGMTIGALVTGFLGDRFGRRFTYQFNLAIFGLASLAAAFAPDITTLNWLRLVMGLGLGAEIVVGYSTLTEFVPVFAWALARLHGVPGRLRPPGDDAARQPDHPEFRLAPDVRHCRRRRPDRLVPAQVAARISALAGIERSHRRSRSGAAGD